MAKMTTRRLTSEQFEQAIHLLHLYERNALRARRVLVDGESMTHIAREEGVSKQLINKQVGKVWRVFLELAQIPVDWRWIHVPLPAEEAVKTERLSERLLKDLGAS